jgi:hypothetical protein
MLLSANGDFANCLNKRLDHRVGFRDLFISTKTRSTTRSWRKVYVGSYGWLFERSVSVARGYPGVALERLDAAGFEAVEAGFLNFARQLREKGIRLLVIGYPDKSRVYPDMVPPAEPLLPSGGNYDKLRWFLSRQSALTFIDFEEILRREKSTNTDVLYYKTDLHANEIGQLASLGSHLKAVAADPINGGGIGAGTRDGHPIVRLVLGQIVRRDHRDPPPAPEG